MPIVEPLDVISTTTITSFEIDSISVALFSSATVRVNVFSGNYRTDVRLILLEGDNYINWGNDDDYINQYVANVLGLTIKPVIIEPVVVEPVVVEPVVVEPVVVEPVVVEPVVVEPVVEPVVVEPVVVEPVVEPVPV